MGEVAVLENGRQVSDVLVHMLADLKNDNLKGAILIGVTEDGMINRSYFHKDIRCVEILGMIEFLKAFILDDMRDHQGTL